MTIAFDMDGTIAELYRVKQWREKINTFDVSPYVEAEPIEDLAEIVQLLRKLQQVGHKIVIISWLSQIGTNNDFNEQTRQAKKQWLSAQNFPYNEIYLIKYGTDKFSALREKDYNAILFDDNEQVRKSWRGIAIDPNKTSILEYLQGVMNYAN